MTGRKMIVRNYRDKQSVLIRQTDHADLAAQLAAWWVMRSGRSNARDFSLLRATAFHDQHFVDSEDSLPVDSQRGRPWGHRETPFMPQHLQALKRNVEWLATIDAYAALLVAKHHVGLRKSRLGAIDSWQGSADQNAKYSVSSTSQLRPEVQEFFSSLETWCADQLSEHIESGRSAQEFWQDYALLQLFDVLSLYMCCDGWDKQGNLEQKTMAWRNSSAEDAGASIAISPNSRYSLTINSSVLPEDPATDFFLITRIFSHLQSAEPMTFKTEFIRSPQKTETWSIAFRRTTRINCHRS